MEAVSSEDAHIDEITQKVRQAYKDEAEVKGKMMELANIHIEAHSFSLSYWDAKMKEAIQTIDDGRKIYTGSWEGRLLWLEGRLSLCKWMLLGRLSITTARCTCTGRMLMEKS